MKNIVVNPKQGGHLFSYNEIKDHKITLNTIRKQIQKVMTNGVSAGAVTGGVTGGNSDPENSRFEPV